MNDQLMADTQIDYWTLEAIVHWTVADRLCIIINGNSIRTITFFTRKNLLLWGSINIILLQSKEKSTLESFYFNCGKVFIEN